MNPKAQTELLNWYSVNKRKLPWRDTQNPYPIWLSEVILQQTRVDQGMSYYLRFMENFPDIHQLANASEEQVLKLWQGLGYYSRARNMHATAKYISQNLNGIFPGSSVELAKLKGIGPYTAAAIASFAFHEAVPVLDGNVFRVLSRLWDEDSAIDSTQGKKRFQLLAFESLNLSYPHLHNQAIMELGALVCKPKNPDCPNCPIQTWCMAFKADTVSMRPVKAGKTKVKNRYMHYFFLENGKSFLVAKRKAGDIWQGLFDLPEISFDVQPSDSQLSQAFQNLNSELKQVPLFSHFVYESMHLLSHRRLFARFYHVRFDGEIPDIQGFDLVELEKLTHLPASRLFEKFQKNYILQKRKQE